jgi:hypothetical protein
MRQGDSDLTRLGPGDRLAGQLVAGLEDVEVEIAGGRCVVPDESAGLIGCGLSAEQGAEELPVGRDDDLGPALGIDHAALERPAPGQPDDLRWHLWRHGHLVNGRGEAQRLDQ